MITSIQNLDIALVGVNKLSPDFLPEVMNASMDIWFLSDGIDPAFMISKALVDMNAANLHLLGRMENGVFRLGMTVLQAEHFPSFEEGQVRRSITLWGCEGSLEQTIDQQLIHAIQQRTRMLVFVSSNLSEVDDFQRVSAVA